jgi:hypothetical protein
MKRRKFLTVFLIALITVSGCGKIEKKPYRVGLINFITGKALVIGHNGSENPAKVGMPVDVGMKIKTIGRNSLCEVYFNENAVKVFGDSEVEIKWLTFNMKTQSDETALEVNKGQMFARVKNKLMKNDVYMVKTPTCLASVRGTDFYVTESKGISTVSCIDGKVDVSGLKAKKDPVTIRGNEEARVVKGKRSDKMEIPAKRIDTLKKDSRIAPQTEKNQMMFSKLNDGDASSVKKVKNEVKTLSGSEPKKDDGHNFDIFGFKG